MIGVDRSEPKVPPFVIVKTPPSRSARVIFPSRALPAASAIAFSISAMPRRVAVADHGHHEALLGRDGDADVVVVVLDEHVALDLRVDRGHLPQGLDDGLHEEGHEAELEAVLLHEVLLVLGAERHHRGHVDLVEGREQRGVVLGRDEALGDPLAQRRELPARLARRPASPAGPRRAWLRRRRGPARPRPPASMSPFVTRPALPVPATAAGSTPVSSARRRTAGDWTGAAACAAFGAGAGSALGAGSAAGAAAAASAAGRRPPASIDGDHLADLHLGALPRP